MKEYVNKEYMEEYNGFYNIKPVNQNDFTDSIPEAVLAKPGEKVFMDFEDIGNPRGRWYAGYMMYEPETGKLHTWGNLRYHCPNSSHHHLGSTCQVCGQIG